MLIKLERTGWRVEGEREVRSGKQGMSMANTDCRHFVDAHHLLACISCVVTQNVSGFNLYICKNNKLVQSSETEFPIQVMTFKILLRDTTLLAREKTNVNCYSLKSLSCSYILITLQILSAAQFIKWNTYLICRNNYLCQHCDRKFRHDLM